MGWTRQSGRVARARRRPNLEPLETRQLLSHASPKPAGGNVNSDGSTNFDQIIGASAARSEYNVDGTGQTVAVIDTGADYNNPILGGGLGAGDKIVAGVDFTGSPNGVIPTWQHGTGVAGLIDGDADGYTGVAPGADIVALRVFGDNNQGSFDAIEQALEWVVANHSEYNITAVNLSVADGGNYTSNIFASSGVGQQITQTVEQLDALNIPVVVAAGNSFDGSSQGLGFPAIVPDTISVTATNANDQLASDAQRLGSAVGGNSAVKIAAPGVNITAPSGDSGTTVESGTSFATPQVTGSIVLLQEMYEQAYHTLPTIAELDQLLQQGAVNVKDGATGITVGRLDVLNSAQILEQQISSQASSGSSSSGGSGTTTSGGSTTDPGSSGTTTNGPTDPQTQVFVNGVSQGDYSTSQLEALYPGLFSLLDGPVPSIQIWAPAGSTVNLGPPPSPSSSTPVPASASVKTATVPKPAATVKLGTEQAKAIKASTTTAVVSHAATATTSAKATTTTTKAATTATKATPKKKTNSIESFFSNLFHF